MKVLAMALLALVFLSVEVVLEQSFGAASVRLDVGVALVVYMALRASVLEGAFTGFVVGYLFDVMTGRPTGLYPFLGVLTFLLVRMAGQFFDGRTRGAYAIFTAVAATLHGLLALFFGWLTSRGEDARAFVPLLVLPVQVVAATVVAAIVWPLLRRIEPGERPDSGVLLQ